MFEWIVDFATHYGYLGIALLMLLENVFPPIPSELIMPMAGYAAARGDMNLIGAIFSGVAGSMLGALFWFYIGRLCGAERLKRWAGRHGRWLTISPKDVDATDAWFDRHGGKAVLFGRLVPAVRTLISVPAGIAGMGLRRFLALSLTGTLVWTGVLAGAGYLLEGQHEAVANYVDPVSKLVVAGIVVTYLYRLFRFRSPATRRP